MEPAEVGLSLITTGGILLVASIILIIIGYLRTVKLTIPFPIGYVDKRPLKGSRKTSVVPFRLRNHTRLEGKVIPARGTFNFSIHDCFGWTPETGMQWQFPAYMRLLDLKRGDEKAFELSLAPGDYTFFFNTKSKKAEANMKITMTEYLKPLAKLVDVGLALIQVAVPILITGFVIYVGLSPS